MSIYNGNLLRRHFYKAALPVFLTQSIHEILGELNDFSELAVEQTQREAWKQQIIILKEVLSGLTGTIFFEHSIPRMGRRVDVIVVIRHVVFVLEFKVGEKKFQNNAIDQVWDYALDLKNFHKASHNCALAPILIATEAKNPGIPVITSAHNDNVLDPIRANPETLRTVINAVLEWVEGEDIDAVKWSAGQYLPTPTIIEAAKALYSQHGVEEILKRDADAVNLGQTTNEIASIIANAKANHEKVICFVTGVPGAGKTLVGLDIATANLDKESGTPSVFLSGNGPLVDILREALTRDKWAREKALGKRVRKGEILGQVKTFIQNVHHFRNTNLQDRNNPPPEHVAIFDEAQRAWNQEQTAKFVKSRYGIKDFAYSEAEFLISCLNRHHDWATIVCLVGGGQELNTGEEGIGAWLMAVLKLFPEWKIYVSPKLTDSEYAAGKALNLLAKRKGVMMLEHLHLAVSMRSFRAEHLSSLVKQVLDRDVEAAQSTHAQIRENYPIVITRDIKKAKAWLKKMARGSERYGLIVSSKAMRLKPHAIDVRIPINHVEWFLNEKDDVRSSYYLEDAATEYKVQGLELDWACVTWDADFRYSNEGWDTWAFVGTRWNRIHQPVGKDYLKNAYRVLLTRARQGMIIVVPEGCSEDATRKPEFYNQTYQFLKSIGFQELA